MHYSTDYVFDGRKVGPYLEDDATAPLNVYGASKLAGELAIANAGVDHLILRTSRIYSLRGRNFLNTIRRLAAQKVAAGRFDAFWEFGLSEWDMAAGALLVQEVGGLVSDFTGGHEFLEKGHVVAGNTKCFKAVLTAIQPHLPPALKR